MTLFSSLVKDWLFREASVFDLITSQGSVTLSTRSGGKNGGELAGLDIDIGRANCRERRRRLIFQYISMRFPGCPKHSQNRYLYFVFFADKGSAYVHFVFSTLRYHTSYNIVWHAIILAHSQVMFVHVSWHILV